MTEGLPPEIERFVERCVRSLGHLEALLLLHRAAPQGFTAAEVGKELYLAAEVVAGQLNDLAASGLLTVDDAKPPLYRFAPTDPADVPLVDALARLYQERRVTIITLIYSKPVNNVQTFADAFRLRKEPPP